MRIAIIPGDGVGAEVTAQAVKVLQAVSKVFSRPMELESLPWGADYYLETGRAVAADGYKLLREDFDAVLLGTLGDPRVPYMSHVREIRLGLRLELDLFVNLRPVRFSDASLCPLNERHHGDFAFLLFQENSEGLHFDAGGRFRTGTEEEIAVQEVVSTFKGVSRTLSYAFNHAVRTSMSKVCMADRSDAQSHTGALWQRVFSDISREYPEIEATHLYADVLAAEVVRCPEVFQVIVTDSMAGSMLSGVCGALQGGAAMSAAGNLNPDSTAVFEPVHGPLHGMAGRDTANPIGSILSAALMLDYLGFGAEARTIERAVQDAVKTGNTTADIGGLLGTDRTGDYVAEGVRRAAHTIG
jgi:3-isopropylmalate dehydrogenase